jgi:hypothetical protein
MAEFNPLDHLDKLEPDGGKPRANGDESFFCPHCGGKNFFVNMNDGRYVCIGSRCHPDDIRNSWVPPVNPNAERPLSTPPRRRTAPPRTIKPAPVAITAPVVLARLQEPSSEPPESLPNGHELPYGDTQKVVVKRQPSGKKVHTPYFRSGDDWVNKAGPDQWPFWRHDEAVQHGAGAWICEAEGEKCCDWLRAGGLVAVSQPGHDHSDCKIQARYELLKAAGVVGIAYLADNDDTGSLKAVRCAEAAAAAGIAFLPIAAIDVWPGLPSGGSIDDACGDAAERAAAFAAAVHAVAPKPAVGVDEFLRDAESLRARLDDGLDKIDAIPDVATRSVALHTLRGSLGLGKPEFESLIQTLSEAKAPRATESFDDLMTEGDDDLTALVDDFLPAGLILIAAEGFAGKSNTVYQIAEAVTNGGKFAGQFQCRKAPALIIQMDESKTDAKRKFKVLGLKPAKGALTIKWHFSPMMFPELRRWVADTGAKLVVLDSLMTIAGGQISPKDAEFGLLIYRLNQLAAELGITILCLHHVVKAGGKQRSEITKDDIFGTAYVYNGSSEAWGLWQSREDNNPEPVFNLRCLKSRSGLVDAGTTYQFDGNDEDKRLVYRGMAGRTVTLDQIRSARDRVIALLQSAGGAALDPKTVNERLQLGNADYARSLCRQLYEQPSVPVGRKRGTTQAAGGRPGYLYFWDGPAREIPVPKLPKPQTPVTPIDLGQQGFGTPQAKLPKPPAEFQQFRQGFGNPPDPSEREESEGVKGGFRYENSLTREGAQPPTLNGHGAAVWAVIWGAEDGEAAHTLSLRIEAETGVRMNGAQVKALVAQGPPPELQHLEPF